MALVKSTYEWIRFLSKSLNVCFWIIFGTFWDLLTRQDAFQKSNSLAFLILWLSDFLWTKKNRRNLWVIYEIFRCKRIDGRRDGKQSQIHKILPIIITPFLTEKMWPCLHQHQLLWPWNYIAMLWQILIYQVIEKIHLSFYSCH